MRVRGEGRVVRIREEGVRCEGRVVRIREEGVRV